MLHKTAATAVCVVAAVLTVATTSPATATAPTLPNPCNLLTTSQLVGGLHPSSSHPTISHTTYRPGTAYEDKSCMWKFGALTVVVNVYNKSGGSGGAPSKTTPEPSLGPNGKLTQSASPQFKFTVVSYKRHTHYVDINVNHDVAPKTMLKLGQDAYKRT